MISSGQVCYNFAMNRKNTPSRQEICELEDFDRLFVTVRSDKCKELVGYYRAFGWESVACEKYGVHDNLLNMEFRRPHRIAEKDALQLLQVYLEAALNTIGGLERIFHPYTVVFGLTVSLLACGLIAAGLCLVFLLTAALYVAFGWALAGAGVAVGLVAGFGTAKIWHIEDRISTARLQTAQEEIRYSCAEAARITGTGGAEADDER